MISLQSDQQTGCLLAPAQPTWPGSAPHRATSPLALGFSTRELGCPAAPSPLAIQVRACSPRRRRRNETPLRPTQAASLALPARGRLRSRQPANPASFHQRPPRNRLAVGTLRTDDHSRTTNLRVGRFETIAAVPARLRSG